MPQVFRVLPILGLGTLFLLLPFTGQSQTSFTRQGEEFAIAGALPGDQVFPQIAAGPESGYVVWEDNWIDGNGSGIAARKLDSTLSGTLSAFRINDAVTGDQNSPQIALLNNRGAIVVWQGGRRGFQHIFARFLGADGTFAGGDISVSTYSEAGQLSPVVAALPDGQSVVVWASYQQDGSMQGIFGQRLSSAGEKLGQEFQVNQFTKFNQRTPAVAALSNGKFVVVWVSEQQRSTTSVDVYARLFDQNGNALGNELRLNVANNVCANPSVAPAEEGGFVAAWGERNPPQDVESINSRSWDIVGAAFAPDGTAFAAPLTVNSELFGDQFGPKVAAAGSEVFVAWTSMGQDTSREGIYARFLNRQGQGLDTEFRVNSTTLNRQIHPALAADPNGRVLVAWAGMNAPSGFDLFAQRFVANQPLPDPAAPYVSALTDASLSISWPEVAGFNVDHFELYMDAETTPRNVRGNLSVVNGLLPASTHSFKLAYVLTDGRRSALSPATSGKTWSADLNSDSLPDDWQGLYWGTNPAVWPAPAEDSDRDGVSNLREFMAGTDPLNVKSVLRTRLALTRQGRRLTWNTQPGLVYQVQESSDIVTWNNLGGLRFAAGTEDTILAPGAGRSTYYRVLRVR